MKDLNKEPIFKGDTLIMHDLMDQLLEPEKIEFFKIVQEYYEAIVREFKNDNKIDPIEIAVFFFTKYINK